MFMHSCLCALCFHARRRFCTACLNSIYGPKKWGGLEACCFLVLIGMLIMSLWVGYQCSYVFVRDPWLISRGSLWPPESCPPCWPALTLPWQRDSFVFQLKRDRLSGIWAPAYHMVWSPNTTLQHVCGNEELLFCVLSVSGLLLLPLVFSLGWLSLCCWCFNVFLFLPLKKSFKLSRKKWSLNPP